MLTRRRIIKKAREANSSKEDNLRHNHVAIILFQNAPVVVGVNKDRTHPALKIHPYGKHNSLHAELDACIKLGKDDCSDYTMVVVKMRRDGTIGSSKPCEGCQSVLNQLNFKKVIYSNSFGEFEELN